MGQPPVTATLPLAHNPVAAISTGSDAISLTPSTSLPTASSSAAATSSLTSFSLKLPVISATLLSSVASMARIAPVDVVTASLPSLASATRNLPLLADNAPVTSMVPATEPLPTATELSLAITKVKYPSLLSKTPCAITGPAALIDAIFVALSSKLLSLITDRPPEPTTSLSLLTNRLSVASLVPRPSSSLPVVDLEIMLKTEITIGTPKSPAFLTVCSQVMVCLLNQGHRLNEVRMTSQMEALVSLSEIADSLPPTDTQPVAHTVSGATLVTLFTLPPRTPSPSYACIANLPCASKPPVTTTPPFTAVPDPSNAHVPVMSPSPGQQPVDNISANTTPKWTKAM